MVDSIAFSQRLCELRKKAGLTQDELADRVNVSVMTVRRWEWGKRIPRATEMQLLIEALNVTANELLNGSEEQDWELRLLVKRGDPTSKGVIDLTEIEEGI